MAKEIHDQPHAVADTLLGRTDEDGRLVLDELRIDEAVLRAVDKIVVHRLRHLGVRRATSPSTRSSTGAAIPVEVELAHEFRYRDPVVNASARWWSRSRSPARRWTP